MPAYLRSINALGVKVVSVYSKNVTHGLPNVTALITLLDTETGSPIALIEGTYLTALRTGATSGVATELLARKNAHTLAVFGAGAEARTHIDAVCCVRDIKELRIYSRTRTSSEILEKEVNQKHAALTVTISQSPTDAVKDSDIIVTATNSATPVFKDEDLPPGVHINAIGSFRPDVQEIDENTVQRAKVIVDSREAVVSEAGDLIIPLKKGIIMEGHIHAELGEILSGSKLGRETDDEVTLFKSVGNAAQDIAIGQAVFKAAEVNDRGTHILL
jgi:ornithine cyclodeaminase/alanine dehydrogenase-like protein (mu-crystallin family)